MNRVYLAGPITGLSHDDARYGWRVEFVRAYARALSFSWSEFEPPVIGTVEFFSPMRGKEHLANCGVLSSDPKTYGTDPISSASGVRCRDRNDCRRADAIVACFLEGGGRPSLGTAWELGIADALQIPVVMIALPGDPHRTHVILERSVGYVVETLGEGVRALRNLLLPAV